MHQRIMAMLFSYRVPSFRFVKPSLILNFKKMKALPMLLMGPLCIYTSLSLTGVGLQTLSYIVFALFLLSFAFMGFLCLRERCISQYGIYHIIFFAILFLCSLLNEESNIKESVYVGLQVVCFFLIFDYYKSDVRYPIYGAAIFFSFCVYVNLLHFLMHSELWIVEESKESTGYLLGGNYNGMGVRMLLALAFSTVCLKYSKWWIVNVIANVICSFLPLLFTQSVTSILGLSLFLLFLIIPSIRIQGLITNAFIIFIILFHVFIVFAGKGLENNPLAVYIIEDVLGKDITLTNRTYLWELSMNVFAESPIWGYGYVDMDWYSTYISFPFGVGPHNIVLSVMINGGLILLGLYLFICVKSLYRTYVKVTRFSVIIRMAVLVAMFMLLTEMQSYVFIFFLIILAYYSYYLKED